MAPNVLITGTPGVGKSSLCEELVKRLGEGYRWHNVSKIAKDNKFVGEYDEELDCPELDEDKVRRHTNPVADHSHEYPFHYSYWISWNQKWPKEGTSSNTTDANSSPSDGSTWSLSSSATTRSSLTG